MKVTPTAQRQAPCTRAASSATCAGSYWAMPEMCSGGTTISPRSRALMTTSKRPTSSPRKVAPTRWSVPRSQLAPAMGP
ncbi:MAG: hypothetical protein WKG00_25755 [Polyangiaceae bacterium]